MRFSSIQKLAVLMGLVAILAFVSLPICHGQATSGIAGTVSDQSGAVVPNATVTVTNKTTGVKITQTTNAVGSYRFADVPPGAGYEVSFSAKGFTTLVVKDIYLAVATVRTQNATLSIGVHEEVSVSAASSLVTVDTTDATVGNDIPVQSINSLPVQQRADPTALFTLQAGVTVDGSVAGARVDQNDVTLDGLDVNEFATGNAVQNNSGVSSGFEGGIVGHAPVDSVEQFHAGVAGNTADTGAAGGGQFELVTKSGTNQFHGNFNEYHRDPSLVANSWFSNNATPKVPRNHLIQNQFGGAIGGPITIPHLFSGRDKAFFFFDYNDSRIIRSAVVNRIVPLDNLRNGTIHYYAGSSDVIESMSPAQVKAMDPAGLGELSAWIGNDQTSLVNTRIKFHSNNNSTGDGLNSGGFLFNAPNNDYLKNYVGRVDYNLTANQKMFARFTVAREEAVNAPNAWPDDPATNPFVDRSYAWVIGHNWLIGTNRTNRVWLGETVEKTAFPDSYNPTGTTAYTMSDGSDTSMTSDLYTWPDSSARRIPVPVLGDDFSLTKGGHTWQWGGTFKDILAHTTNVTDFNLAEIGLGGQISGLCGPNPGDCNPSIPSESLRPSDIDPAQAALWDEPFLYTLGRIGNVNSVYNYDKTGNALSQLTGDQRYYRYYELQLYAQDTWKVLPGLSLNYGLNYQWFSVPYETRGLESVEPYTFNQYFGARVTQSQLGESGPDAVPIISYALGGKGNGSGAPGLFQPEYRNLAPHVGFDWIPGFDKKMVVNGSAGVIYDRTVILAVQTIQDADSYLFQQSKVVQNGVSTDPYDSIATDPRLDGSNGFATPFSHQPHLGAPATPTPPYQPFATPSVCAALGFSYSPCGLQDGYAFNATIDPALKTPYSLVFDFGVQRELPWHMVAKATYVSRLGRRLLAQADAEQILDFTDTQSGQLLSQAFTNVVKQVRQNIPASSITTQPWFEDLVGPGLGITPGSGPTATQVLAGALNVLFQRGDFADFTQGISALTPQNVGMATQFSENSFYYNGGFSAYNGLLTTLSKNMSNGLQFDFNYTWSHSIDNTSFFANSEGDTGIGSGIGLICDVVRPRECRSRSDFDIRHMVTTDATYQLPFGKGRTFFASVPHWTDEIIGAWDLSGVASFHSGEPWTTSSLAFVASYSNDAPAIFVGTNSAAVKNHLTKLPGGGVSDFANSLLASQQFSGPLGFQIGPRNSMTGPRFFDADMGLQKTFPIYKEALNLKFRADAFNVLNHPNFGLPTENGYNGFDQTDILKKSGFGKISSTVSPPGNLNSGARVLQLSLRVEY
jgi:hypothetical protein